MDVRYVELSLEDILSIHRHWITKLYLDDQKSEDEIVNMLYERRLPVTLSQVQRCLTEWDVISSPPTSRPSSASPSPTQLYSEGWDTLRSPSPTSSATSFDSTHSTEPENIAFYSKRPLPSLPYTASTARSTSASRSRISTSRPQNLSSRRKRFADCSSDDLLRVTCHSSMTRSYEIEMTLGVIPYTGPGPLDLYTGCMKLSHERIVLHQRRVNIPPARASLYSFNADCEEFEWMRQWRAHSGGRSRRVVEVLQKRDAGDVDDEHGYERGLKQ